MREKKTTSIFYEGKSWFELPTQCCSRAGKYYEGKIHIMRDAGKYDEGNIFGKCWELKLMSDTLRGNAHSAAKWSAERHTLSQTLKPAPASRIKNSYLAWHHESRRNSCKAPRFYYEGMRTCKVARRDSLLLLRNHYEGISYIMRDAAFYYEGRPRTMASFFDKPSIVFYIMRDAGHTAPANNYRSQQYLQQNQNIN